MFGQFFHQHERHLAHDASSTKPKRGMIVAFKAATEPELANIPARITRSFSSSWIRRRPRASAMRSTSAR